MTILDTNVVVERVKRKEKIEEDITALTLVEFPKVVSYERFYGNIVYPEEEDFELASKVQLELLNRGKPQDPVDVLIASIAVNLNEDLMTYDEDFLYIKEAMKSLGYDMKLLYLGKRS